MALGCANEQSFTPRRVNWCMALAMHAYLPVARIGGGVDHGVGSVFVVGVHNSHAGQAQASKHLGHDGWVTSGNK